MLSNIDLISYLSMLVSRLLTVAALAQLASCSPVSSADSLPSSPSLSALNVSSLSDTTALDIVGGTRIGQTALDKRNNDDVYRQNARKRGIPWQLRGSGSLAPFHTLASYYTYSPYGYNVSEAGPGFVPQLWGCSDAHVDEFQARMNSEWAVAGSDRESTSTPFCSPFLRTQLACIPHSSPVKHV